MPTVRKTPCLRTKQTNEEHRGEHKAYFIEDVFYSKGKYNVTFAVILPFISDFNETRHSDGKIRKQRGVSVLFCKQVKGDNQLCSATIETRNKD